MRVGIVGGGILGLTLAWRLARLGHEVKIFEAGAEIGGLSGSHDYGQFVWDRFYHCILPQDTHLLALLGELGLEAELRWKRTGTGYYAGGRAYSMSGAVDFLRFPLLSVVGKARLAAAILYAKHAADPERLWNITAEEWLRKLCGKRTYSVFWAPLLKAKLGVYHDRVAAVYLWATITRLFGARARRSQRECLGYVHGGYRRILERFRQALSDLGAAIQVRSPVEMIRLATGPGGEKRCEVSVLPASGSGCTETFDQVFFTAPARLARTVVSPDLVGHVDRMERVYPTSSRYLGIVCLAALLRNPLTPYYVLNVAEEHAKLTGVVEMTNLIDRATETNGFSFAYLPRYLDSEDPLLRASDDDLRRSFIDQGLKLLFPQLEERDIVSTHIHRARYVQPLPLAGSRPPGKEGAPLLEKPFQMVGTFMLRCATLNNNEVVGFVNRFVDANEAGLALPRRAGRSFINQ